MTHSIITVSAEHPYRAEMEKQLGHWPLTFDIQVYQHPMIEGFEESGKFYGNCHLGCSKDYPSIESMVRDLLRRHGYRNPRIIKSKQA